MPIERRYLVAALYNNQTMGDYVCIYEAGQFIDPIAMIPIQIWNTMVEMIKGELEMKKKGGGE